MFMFLFRYLEKNTCYAPLVFYSNFILQFFIHLLCLPVLDSTFLNAEHFISKSCHISLDIWPEIQATYLEMLTELMYRSI